MTFWDHLDELRGVLLRVLAVVAACSVVAFCLKDLLFSIVLAPCDAAFVTYRVLGAEPFTLRLMNTGLTEQFALHVKASLFAGLLCASPYAVYALFRFVSPGLYAGERRFGVRLVGSAYVMFLLGALVNYFLIFPLTVRFLGTYQVSPDVANMLTLQSYMDTLLGMTLVLGVVFELPVLCWLLARMGWLTAARMRLLRRHAFVAVLALSAVITPTTDAFTLFLVAVPVWLLYEGSIFIVAGAASGDKG
ncbi:MAG: twin-arginine translocase subunit TatC [Alloprevotella sp.]|nr:twin-arginine translocase subunit TatC [Alloprevotella sp.]